MVVSQGSSDGLSAPIHSIMTLLNLARTQVTRSGMGEAKVSAMTVSSNSFKNLVLKIQDGQIAHLHEHKFNLGLGHP